MRTKGKRVTGRAILTSRGETTAHLEAHQQALENAHEVWVDKYGENVPWDNVSFRGGHTTTEVVIELWEETA